MGYNYDMKELIRKNAMRRLEIAIGQIRGIQKMIKENMYCVNIINQSLAAKQALSSVEDLLLENHLSSHVIEQMKSGKGTKSIQEILKVYKLSKKK